MDLFSEEGEDFLRYLDAILGAFSAFLIVYPFVGHYSLDVIQSRHFIICWGSFVIINILLSKLYKNKFVRAGSKFEVFRTVTNIFLTCLAYYYISLRGIDYWYLFLIMAVGNTSLSVMGPGLKIYLILPITTGPYAFLSWYCFYKIPGDDTRILNGAVIAFVTVGTFNLASWMKSKYREIKTANDALQEMSEGLDETVKERTAEIEQISKYKTEFLAKMSHDIRTPLNSILGVGDLLKEKLEGDNLRLVELMKKSGSQLRYLINDILDYSRIESGDLKIVNNSFDLDQRLRHLVSVFSPSCAEKGIYFGIQVNPGVPEIIVGDPFRLFQILSNLVSNSIKFTEKGRIEVEVSAYPGRDERAPVELEFIVQDTGIGIPEEELDGVFASFRQAHTLSLQKGGVGLGLSIVHLITGLMGGEVKVQSRVNAGTTFRVRIPFKVGDKETLEESLAATPEMKSGGRVLVAEDVEENQLLIEAFFKGTNVDLEFVENGALALAQRKEKKYDMILMDMNMPIMDGYESIRLIRRWEEESKVPGISIVGLSAYATEQDKARCLAAGANDYMTKPIKKTKLNALVEKYLNKTRVDKMKYS